MENIRNQYALIEIEEVVNRQYTNALSIFTALEEAEKKATQCRGGMYWKTHIKTKIDYLIRTQPDNSQKCIGPRSSETEAIYEKFTSTKIIIESRIHALRKELERNKRLNRALSVGYAPKILIDVLNVLSRKGVAKDFKVIGPQAIYAFEAAACVRIKKESAPETPNANILWQIDKKLKLQTQINYNEKTMITLLKKIDKSFEISKGRNCTAINAKGFEVEFIHLKEWAIPMDIPFSIVIVSKNGQMARMNTMSPLEFIEIVKLGEYSLQASIIEKLVIEYLPQLVLDRRVTCQ